MTTYFSKMDSPIGELLLVGDGTSLTQLLMLNQKYYGSETQQDWQRDDVIFRAARDQLKAYFAGELRTFNLPLAPTGTAFQRKVWQALRDIPYGQTESYGALAKRIDSPKASRAVGMANGHNPISIIVPCHRVIGANGNLTGYGGGIERKRWLLEHEGWKREREVQKVLF